MSYTKQNFNVGDILKAEHVNKIEDGIVAVETANTALDERVTAVETANTALDERVTAVETANTALDERVTAVETANTALDERVTELETNSGGSSGGCKAFFLKYISMNDEASVMISLLKENKAVMKEYVAAGIGANNLWLYHEASMNACPLEYFVNGEKQLDLYFSHHFTSSSPTRYIFNFNKSSGSLSFSE